MASESQHSKTSPRASLKVEEGFVAGNVQSYEKRVKEIGASGLSPRSPTTPRQASSKLQREVQLYGEKADVYEKRLKEIDAKRRNDKSSQAKKIDTEDDLNTTELQRPSGKIAAAETANALQMKQTEVALEAEAEERAAADAAIAAELETRMLSESIAAEERSAAEAKRADPVRSNSISAQEGRAATSTSHKAENESDAGASKENISSEKEDRTSCTSNIEALAESFDKVWFGCVAREKPQEKKRSPPNKRPPGVKLQQGRSSKGSSN
eukprot:TRINITY_DN24635_c0_g1_i1.p1 TRINITY_DN24635_c0_g1~~TRINITY_DN24635_c0_g1_i1.p1  ORF type:complete len:268 (+),score=61.11 TRINITY_DN24635_c0_g1_i1:66-869(+)